MIKYKDMVLVNQQMEISMKVIGKMIKEKEMVIIFGMIKMNILEIGSIIKEKEKVIYIKKRKIFMEKWKCF